MAKQKKITREVMELSEIPKSLTLADSLTTEDLLSLLKTRFDHFVFAGCVKENNKDYSKKFRHGGDLFMLLGLIEFARDDVKLALQEVRDYNDDEDDEFDD